MPEELERTPAVLTRYFAGDCSRAEAEAFERWMRERPERESFVAELRRVWRAGEAGGEASIDADAAWAKITSQLAGLSGTAVRPSLRLERGGAGHSAARATRLAALRFARRAAMAAGVTLTVGGGLWWTFMNRLDRSPTQYAVYSTEQGGRRTVTLRDGTHVTLGPQSRLRVARHPSTSNGREVELDGQAFFQVAHDPEHPFRVRARGTEARVLGTEFTVRAYADERDVQVAVRSGRVAVRSDTATGPTSPRQVPVLAAGEEATVTPGQAIRLSRVADESMFEWIVGPLRFESVSFADVARDMGRWIGTTIVVASPELSAMKVTVAFPNLSRDAVIARLAALGDARSVRTKEGFVLLQPITP